MSSTDKQIESDGRPGNGSSGVKEVTRYIKPEVTAMLWGRAAGRCQFSGCNTPLWKSPVTQEVVNRAQRAHIYAFSASGPRGHRGVPKESLNNFNNLMLLCHGCHKKIDQSQDGGRYSATLLQQWKASHERRIETVTGIDPAKGSTVVLYGANIGSHSSPLNFTEAASALFPTHYPADDHPIQLGTVDSTFNERTELFWKHEAESLRTKFDQRIRERVSTGDIDHISVFGLAPQPLLILLGTLMIDITNAEVFQRHREPQTWSWPKTSQSLTFDVDRPAEFTNAPALALALSAPVADDRIVNAIGRDSSIWRVTVPEPNTDLIKSRQHLSQFRSVVRPLLDEIKARHGQDTLLHVFPVVGVSAAVEFGRIRMPKAHMPMQIYDQVNGLGGFVPALTISN